MIMRERKFTKINPSIVIEYLWPNKD